MSANAKVRKEKVTNGVNVTALAETIKAIRSQPEIADFQFRASNEWLGAGHNRSTIKEFHGACQEDTGRTEPFVMDADEPPVLLGEDKGANPVEHVLHALAACLTTSMVFHAASRGIHIESVESSFEGDIDLHGFLGLSEDVPKGYQQIRAGFKVRADDATADELMQCAMFSPVYSMISKGVHVEVHMNVQ